MALNWYAIKVLNNQENKVKAYLDRNNIRAIVNDNIKEVVIPTERYYEKTKDGEKKLVEKKLMSGYILIQAELTEIALSTIKHTPGVIGFLSYKDNSKTSIPNPLKDREVEQFLGKRELSEDDVIEVEKYLVGETVKINDGPFKTFNGTVVSFNEEKNRIKIDVSIFGRITSVELDFKQVEKVAETSKV